MLEKATAKGEAKQSLELPRKAPMKAIVSPYRHTTYSIYSTHYFYNIVLYPLHFSKPSLRLLLLMGCREA